jgi:RimJ/RimL family protein N-acetyltransferase
VSGDPQVPALDTERLALRGHTLADFDECLAMWADPIVNRYIGGRSLSAEEVWARLLRYAGLWTLLGFGYWVVREKSSGRFVGEVGLADFRRDLGREIAGVPEVGWIVVPSAHGRGFATEAVQAVVAWGDAHLRMPRSVCLIAPENTASIRVASKCGFHESVRTTYKGVETLIFERERVAPC